MASLTHRFDIYSNGAWVTTEPVIQPPVQYYRVPHDIERIKFDEPNANWTYTGKRTGPVRDAVINDPLENPGKNPMPEVYRNRYPEHSTLLSCGWVKLWRNLNPDLSDDKFCALLDNKLAWTNGTGWPGRKNCIKGTDLYAKDPAFHTVIINGGAILKGVEKDGWLEIENLRTDFPVPSAEDVLNRPWLWYWGTSITRYGTINLIRRMNKSGTMIPIRVPLITRYPIKWPLKWLHKLPAGFTPPSASWMPS